MASLSSDLDIEAQANSDTGTQPAIIPLSPTNTENPQLPASTAVPQPQSTNANEHHNGNTPAQQTAADNPQVQRDENHGDSSDGFWSMYLTEAEKQDAEVTESWKGDTDGILVFTGLFSATVATFIIESYQKLSPDSSDTTNALLTQISHQLVNISNGTPLTSVGAQGGHPFKPTASAVRVNVLWFLSLILSLSCALSATLMQQWARRYRELAQRRSAFHRRGRMRAYIFEGIDRFGMARAVATMPTLLHISVFLFFAGLVDFLFPIYATVAYATLAYIMMFALAYAILTVLPTIYFNCPYATPLSGFTWRISQFSTFGFLWTVLKIEGLLRKPLLKLRVIEPVRLETWRETIKEQVKIHQHWFSQSLRKSMELSAFRAESTVVTSALVWTLAALDEDKEIEDFAARVPGFFDSRVVPDATLAVLPLLSHRPNTDPVFGPRLYDLLRTCIPETSTLDEKKRMSRLRVCMECLWYFAKAYNQIGSSQVLPSYFSDALASPEITRRVRAEEDSSVRVIGRCFGALIVNKLAADLESRAGQIGDGELACLSAILGTESDDVKLLLSQPGAVALANMISFTFGSIGGPVTDTVPLGVLDVVRQTLGTLSRAASSEQNAEVQLDHPIAIIDGSDGMFEQYFLTRLLDILNTCIQVPSPLAEQVHRSCWLVCLSGLWHFGRAFNQLGNSVPLPSYVYTALANPDTIRPIYLDSSPTSVIACCVRALVVSKLVSDFNSLAVPVSDGELECLSAILGTESNHVILSLRHPGATELTNLVFLALDDLYSFPTVPSYVLDVFQQTLTTLSRALPSDLDPMMRLNQTDILMNLSDGASSLTDKMHKEVLRMWMKNLWEFTKAQNERRNLKPLPSYVCIAFTNPEITRRIRKRRNLTLHLIGRCIEALIADKLAADINSRTVLVTDDAADANPHNVPVTDDELACLSAILGTEIRDVRLCLGQPGTIQLVNLASLALGDVSSLRVDQIPLDTRSVLRETIAILSHALPAQANAELPLDQAGDLAVTISDDKTERTIVSRLHGLFKICIPGASSLIEEVRTSCLRMCLKALWRCGIAYHQTPNPLPSYFSLVLATPEIIRHFQTEQDPVAQFTGCCFGALIVSKLVDAFGSPIYLSDSDRNAELARISAILGTEHRDALPLPHQLHLINLRDVVSFMSGVIGTSSTATGMPMDVLDMAQDTLFTLALVLFRPPFVGSGMPRDQQRLLEQKLQEVASDFSEALRFDQLRNETVRTLDQLRRILENHSLE